MAVARAQIATRRPDLDEHGIRDELLCERVLYYWARLSSAQLHRGDSHTRLQPVVCVFIANFRELPGDRFHSTFRLLEVHSQRPFSEALQLHFLELPKLPSPSEVQPLTRPKHWC